MTTILTIVFSQSRVSLSNSVEGQGSLLFQADLSSTEEGFAASTGERKHGKKHKENKNLSNVVLHSLLSECLSHRFRLW